MNTDSMSTDQLHDIVRRLNEDLAAMRVDIARRQENMRNIEHWLTEYQAALEARS